MKSNLTFFTARDIHALCGLTYRQINDWDANGALTFKKSPPKGQWRRLNCDQMFALMVCTRVMSIMRADLSVVKVMMRQLEFLNRPWQNEIITLKIAGGVSLNVKVDDIVLKLVAYKIK